jgi:hypothetical protein
MNDKQNDHYDDNLPRLTEKRIKCQVLDANGTKCNHPAQIEMVIHQDFMTGKLWAAVFLCSGCAIRDIKTFFKSTYENLLEKADFDKFNEKVEASIASTRVYNERAKRYNKLVRAEKAGDISAAEFLEESQKIFPDDAMTNKAV